jgi:hypothetical protein
LLCHRTIFFSSFPSFKWSLPGRLLPWRRKRPASKLTEISNSLRQDSGSPPRLNFVELGLLPLKSPLWVFHPLALVLFSVHPLWVILQWSALACCVPHRSSVFTLAFTSLGAGTRRRWSGLGLSHAFLSAGVFIPVQVFISRSSPQSSAPARAVIA